nr:immunoglobulin light chain junction region [Macaca mulatta]MOY14698.1 immunoglobulin light chain junction region [Macaca mulatta]MOY14925.1 immunoglobulin light chain junction region [Macaca mulatta]MOY14938.1 immunoglobulin light chain junction region [Macaca mulatta]MOY15171.1 immunoglobulin light chain junction region [Macaca mulatta]
DYYCSSYTIISTFVF